ncbi:MAG: VOC family protein [Planctomycetaceae bacterium]
MFDGRAAEAMRFYCQAVPGAELLELVPWPAGGPPGTPAASETPGAGTGGERVYKGRFQLGGQRFMAFDSPVKHEFGFTPAVSVFLEVSGEGEFNQCVEGLSAGGQFLMPAGDYGFSRRFAWFNDQFGVSWQVNWV